MANTIAVSQAHPVTPKHAHVGVVLLSVVTTETYATPTGFTVDFSTILTDLGIAFSDVLFIQGTTLTGHTITPIKTATAGQFTVRLWNGATEIANGALTQTLSVQMFYAQGAKP
jgi:hypothetical protein